MRILFSAIPGYGHVLPLIPLAEAAIRHGHEAVVATGDPLLGRLSVPSVRGYPPGTLSEAEEEVMRRHPELATVPPDERFRIGLELFADVGFEAVRSAVRRLIIEQQPSLVVYEAMAVGAAAAALEHGAPACVLTRG